TLKRKFASRLIGISSPLSLNKRFTYQTEGLWIVMRLQ
ncbi:leukocidin/Hemolysin toxin family protein, partial [Vibrio parahaemolyticus EKP-028]